jgi:kumamolisin
MRDLGPVAATTPVRVGLFMRYRDERELRSLVRLQGMRGSPIYHHFLSKAQWNAAFAPSESAVGRVALALRAAGFRLEPLASNRGIVVASAPARLVERFFDTPLRRVIDRHAGRGFVNLRPPLIPPALRDVVASVAGLSSLPIATYPRRARLVAQLPERRRPRPTPSPLPTPSPSPVPTASPTPMPLSTSTPAPNPSPQPTLIDGLAYVEGPMGGYGPVAVAVAYDYPVMHGYDGLGRTVGDIISSDFLDSDLASELRQFGETRGGVTNRISVDGGPGPSNADAALESTTDVEAIVGLSPGVTYDEYLIPALNELEMENAYNQVDADDLVDAVNSSFGSCEADDPTNEYVEDELALQGAALGVTFLAATGDSGALACPGSSGEGTVLGIEAPAAADYFVAVGATNPVLNVDNGAYLSEEGWEDSGGGVSVFEPLPSWQAATANVITSGRNTPDVSLLGGDETGYAICDMGVFVPSSGTSVSSALFTSLVVQIDGVQGSRNGWINPQLYRIVNGQGYGYAFRDVVGGTNGYYTATSGYDNVTGIGSPLGWEMAGEL